MSIYTYDDVSIDPITLDSQLLQSGSTGGITYNVEQQYLIVSSNLDRTTVDQIVAAHDPDSLFAKKVNKLLEFDRRTYNLINAGIYYGSPRPILMAVDGPAKTLYTSVASDDDNAGVNVPYPVQLPGITMALEVANRTELDAFINTVNDRLVYLYEDQENADGSKGLMLYSSLIFAATTESELDAIVDTRE